MISLGALIVIAGRRESALSEAAAALTKTGGKVGIVAGDVGTEEGRKRFLTEAVKQLGGLDVLVNNAGAVRAGRLEMTSESEMIEVDLIAPILLTREALPFLRDGGGMVVNVTSGIALNGVPFYATYAAAKSGLARYSEALRRELLGEGVHVLTVALEEATRDHKAL
jgi:short-subunit dehydrogenase